MQPTCPAAHFLDTVDEPEIEIMQELELNDKIRQLPPDKQIEVEVFVDFLKHRDEELRLTQGAARLSEEAFRQVWDNEADSAYDKL